jgi:hypothetical protein
MPVPKPLRKFAKSHWLSIRGQLGVSGQIRITASPKKVVEEGMRRKRGLPVEVPERLIKTYSETPTAASYGRKKSALIYINLKETPGFVKRPKEQHIAHELGHAANMIACKNRRVLPSRTNNEFIAFWSELEYAKERNRGFYNALLSGKYDERIERLRMEHKKQL